MSNEEHMTDEIHVYFQSAENCYRDLGYARKLFGSTRTTEPEYDAMEKALGIMFLHCPEDLQDIVHATMFEATQRRFYFEIRWSNEELDKAEAMG